MSMRSYAHGIRGAEEVGPMDAYIRLVLSLWKVAIRHLPQRTILIYTQY